MEQGDMDLSKDCKALSWEVPMSSESCDADNGDEAPSDRRSKVFPSEFLTGALRGSGEGSASFFTAENDIFTEKKREISTWVSDQGDE